MVLGMALLNHSARGLIVLFIFYPPELARDEDTYRKGWNDRAWDGNSRLSGCFLEAPWFLEDFHLYRNTPKPLTISKMLWRIRHTLGPEVSHRELRIKRCYVHRVHPGTTLASFLIDGPLERDRSMLFELFPKLSIASLLLTQRTQRALTSFWFLDLCPCHPMTWVPGGCWIAVHQS